MAADQAPEIGLIAETESGMKRDIFGTFGIGLLLFCGACSIEIPPPSVIEDGIAQSRPESEIGPMPDRASWRRFSVSIAKKRVLAVRHAQSTFHVVITDCEGKPFYVEDLYANGVSLNLLASMQDDSEFDTFYNSLKDPVQGYIYLDESIYAKQRQICGLFTGGGYTGFKIDSDKFQIK